MNNLTFKILKAVAMLFVKEHLKIILLVKISISNIACFVFKIVTLFITIITINNYISYCVFVTAVQLHTYRLLDFCL